MKKAVDEFARIDVLVNNAAHQMSLDAIEEISDEEWEKTLSTNISAMFYIVKAAVAHMPEGSSIINTASVNADAPSPHLLAYATTKGAEIQDRQAGFSLAEKGIRANAVAPGPVWTPFNSFDNACRGRHAFRRTGPDEATRAAVRARVCLCHARI